MVGAKSVMKRGSVDDAASLDACAPEDAGDARFASGVMCPCPPMPIPCPWSAVTMHGGVLEESALPAPRQERLDLRVGLLDLREVLVVVGAARVAGLVHAEQLEHQQFGVVLEQHALRLARSAHRRFRRCA